MMLPAHVDIALPARVAHNPRPDSSCSRHLFKGNRVYVSPSRLVFAGRRHRLRNYRHRLFRQIGSLHAPGSLTALRAVLRRIGLSAGAVAAGRAAGAGLRLMGRPRYRLHHRGKHSDFQTAS